MNTFLCLSFLLVSVNIFSMEPSETSNHPDEQDTDCRYYIQLISYSSNVESDMLRHFREIIKEDSSNSEMPAVDTLRESSTPSEISSSSSSNGLPEEELQKAGIAVAAFFLRHLNNPSLDPYAPKQERPLQERPRIDTLNDRNRNTPTFKLAASMQDGDFTDASVKALLDQGAHPNPRYNNCGCITFEDLLTHAIDKNASLNCVSMLLEKGADDLQTKEALRTAARKVRPDIVKLLLEKGKKPSASDLFACWKKQDPNVYYHYQEREPESADKKIEDRTQVTRLLLAAGCNPEEKNNNGKTIAQLALADYNTDITQLIKEASEARKNKENAEPNT